jgi:hypothetical protein
MTIRPFVRYLLQCCSKVCVDVLPYLLPFRVISLKKNLAFLLLTEISLLYDRICGPFRKNGIGFLT